MNRKPRKPRRRRLVQLGLPLDASRAAAPTCAFGVDWLAHHVTRHDCPYCHAEAIRLDEQFDADVEAGTLDEHGYKRED